MKYIIDPFKNLFNFTGKTSIKEFWIFQLFLLLLAFPLGIVESILKIDNIGLVVLIILSIGIGFRRLNDVGINKFLYLIPFVNLVLASLPANYSGDKQESLN